ncbi:MAG: SDR family oxidoreductase [Flavobacteriaceae bacterium]|nr:SDR family oxidoreductase [Flavobacteriaceae bacterium]
MDLNLDSKTVLITGGASGIGKAICTQFWEAGANVIILDTNTEKVKVLLDELTTKDRTPTHFNVDISHSKALESLGDSCNSLDILVNCAGISHIGTIEDTSEADFDRLYSVNVKGIFNVTKSFIPIFKKKKSGVILNITSVAATVGISERFAYSMTKGAALSMTYSIAKDYINYGIRCNSISPARIHTPFVDDYLQQHYPKEVEKMFQKLSKTQPIGRMGTPKEVADLALFLCSDKAKFITGTDFPIDGGFLKLNT